MNVPSPTTTLVRHIMSCDDSDTLAATEKVLVAMGFEKTFQMSQAIGFSPPSEVIPAGVMEVVLVIGEEAAGSR